MLFKTHVWNEDVQRQFDRVCQSCRSGHVFLVLDANNRPIPVPPGANAVWFSDVDMETYGLYNYGGWWFNGDYQTILFFLKYPEYQYYVSLEYDVAVFNDLDAIVEDMSRNDIDAVYTEIPETISRWPHVFSTIDYYNFRDIHYGLFCISFLSRAMLSCLYSRRLAHDVLRRRLNLHTWPQGEAVLGSEALLSGLKTRDLKEYCDSLSDYHWNRGCTEAYVDLIAPQRTFVHPVAGVQKCISTNMTSDIRQIDDTLMTKAWLLGRLDFYSHLYHLPDNSEADRARVLEEARVTLADRPEARFLFQRSLTTDASASQSSESGYSRRQGEAVDAFRVLPSGMYAFHTDFEDAPWWLADLHEVHEIDTVVIFDREDVSRSEHLVVEVGETLDDMQVVFRRDGHGSIGGIRSGGLYVTCERPARFVRISLDQPGMLHLDAIYISALS